jgi:hypothetical protein
MLMASSGPLAEAWFRAESGIRSEAIRAPCTSSFQVFALGFLALTSTAWGNELHCR